MPKDLDQSAKMLNMRIKIDVWSKGLDEDIREEIRVHLQDLFCQLPSRRVWYYLKRIRYMGINGTKVGEEFNLQLDADHLMDGPEDIIVKGKYHSLAEPTLSFHS